MVQSRGNARFDRNVERPSRSSHKKTSDNLKEKIVKQTRVEYVSRSLFAAVYYRVVQRSVALLVLCVGIDTF